MNTASKTNIFKMGELVLDFLDHDGKRYVFTKKNFKKHSNKHKELLEPGYLKGVEKLVRNCHPRMIYPSYRESGSYVYYKKIKETFDGTLYDHAIIKKDKGIYIIKTAFRFVIREIREKYYGDCVKERP